MSFCRLLDRVGSDGLAFGALDSELELLAIGHGVRFPGTLFIIGHGYEKLSWPSNPR
jgi:hypothetical protein